MRKTEQKTPGPLKIKCAYAVDTRSEPHLTESSSIIHSIKFCRTIKNCPLMKGQFFATHIKLRLLQFGLMVYCINLYLTHQLVSQ